MIYSHWHKGACVSLVQYSIKKSMTVRYMIISHEKMFNLLVIKEIQIKTMFPTLTHQNG